MNSPITHIILYIYVYMYMYVCNNVMQENRVLDVPLTQMGVMDPQVANTPKTQNK